MRAYFIMGDSRVIIRIKRFSLVRGLMISFIQPV